MVRWQPGTRDRLQQAALELYATRGFEQTTVAEIAGAVGLTERTFFRHFVDKREVLFGGTAILLQGFTEGVASAPDVATPMEIVASAVTSGSAFFTDERRDYSRSRQGVILANEDLRERELLKMATLAAAVAQALRDRGVAEPAASLTAESGVAVFRLAFEQWIVEGEQRSLPEIERAFFDELYSLTARRSSV
jgi:AcrR family transcriptional regulator